MQYLLTEDEYAALNKQQSDDRIKLRSTLQALCQEVATFKPVKVEWREEIEPWGCILNDLHLRNPGYCDHCPVQEQCPNDHKEWSQ